ncbi:MAG TPA: SAM-dependent chlorinase/fluorinase [Candidatus Tectomicrobia bacterium]|nr:SAM-dependent chlorinase/fluorinase [Candidatus Tectomicrobia bacterium]
MPERRAAVAGIVTLTTDFGLRDAYVAEMKGVMLGIAHAAGRALCLVDVTHEVARHDVTEAALALEAAVPRFPPGTVHLAVVDPGVGTARRALAVAAAGAVLVGPDNGLFTPFLAGGDWRAFELTESAYRLPVVSRTFHGRDVFAPAAAHLALGLDPERLGPPVPDPVRLPWPEVREVAGAVAGAVVHTDRFGNLITSIHLSGVPEDIGGLVIRVGGQSVRLVGTYADLDPGALGALVGSSGRLEIAVREGSAAARLRAGRGTPVLVSRRTSSSRRRPRSRA